MDGTLLNTEDLYTEATTELLARYGKGPFTWDKKIKVAGLPGSYATNVIINEYKLPLTAEEYLKEVSDIQLTKWPKTHFLPGALELLDYLKQKKIPMALGTSSTLLNYERKTGHLKEGFEYFGDHIVTGDDKRIADGRGKPHPDIWHACLDSINADRNSKGLENIKIEECLIFEDSHIGVKSGVASNAHVIWIPHPEASHLFDESEDGEYEIITNLNMLDKAKYYLE
ncbi:uncharacterized protein KGF55_003079 [Candida pseudojiufengensis]|uniref:uncharacterized protein n=1 Tax=Candida pseudojiufengensis TaxID=497109 RepID=UPI002223FD45|nr:uncharacterized protein KGF55_003079 [Candida pseudojiufengensis]KAI5963287.1 hypothetical protein KGF55_003079 [Candida pseudojiufengensis]